MPPKAWQRKEWGNSNGRSLGNGVFEPDFFCVLCTLPNSSFVLCLPFVLSLSRLLRWQLDSLKFFGCVGSVISWYTRTSMKMKNSFVFDAADLLRCGLGWVSLALVNSWSIPRVRWFLVQWLFKVVAQPSVFLKTKQCKKNYLDCTCPLESPIRKFNQVWRPTAQRLTMYLHEQFCKIFHSVAAYELLSEFIAVAFVLWH